MTSRRAFIFGLGASLAVIRTPGLLMPIKPVVERVTPGPWLTLVEYASSVVPDGQIAELLAQPNPIYASLPWIEFERVRGIDGDKYWSPKFYTKLPQIART